MEKIYQQATQCYADFLKNNVSDVSSKVVTYDDIATINNCLGTSLSIQVVNWRDANHDY